MPGAALTRPGAGPGGAPAGFHGKMPAHGDFVVRNLPRAFVERWDGWLQDALTESREALGDGWDEAFPACPPWRFLLPAGACGPDAMMGLLVPSVDKVGRPFPLTIARRGPPAAGWAMDWATEWFDAAEALAAAALDRRTDAQALAVRAAALPDPALPDGDTGEPREASGHSLWWSAGSRRVPPARLVHAGLPPPVAFTAFLDGDWDRWGWSGGKEPA